LLSPQVDNAPPLMRQHEEHIQDLKPNGRHREEVNRDEVLEVILEERAPDLGGWFSAAHQVLAHAGLADVDAELEQFPVDARRAPAGILAAHVADQGANLW